jgi:hypothetical protein
MECGHELSRVHREAGGHELPEPDPLQQECHAQAVLDELGACARIHTNTTDNGQYIFFFQLPFLPEMVFRNGDYEFPALRIGTVLSKQEVCTTGGDICFTSTISD